MIKTKSRRVKKEKTKAKKIFDKTCEILSGILLVFLVVMIAIALVQKVTGQQSQLFGYSITKILTNSMELEIMTDDVILEKLYTGQELSVGDIITFRAPEESSIYVEGMNYTITHRIVSIDWTPDGGYVIQTKGDHNSKEDDFTIDENDVVSVYVATLSVMTVVFKVISNFWGFLFLIVLPLVFILIFQIVKLVKLKNMPSDSAEANSEEEKITFTEEEIKKFIEEENNKKD